LGDLTTRAPHHQHHEHQPTTVGMTTKHQQAPSTSPPSSPRAPPRGRCFTPSSSTCLRVRDQIRPENVRRHVAAQQVVFDAHVATEDAANVPGSSDGGSSSSSSGGGSRRRGSHQMGCVQCVAVCRAGCLTHATSTVDRLCACACGRATSALRTERVAS
jgi:hypothetical protein